MKYKKRADHLCAGGVIVMTAAIDHVILMEDITHAEPTVLS
jgi:hypothetical protein